LFVSSYSYHNATVRANTQGETDHRDGGEAFVM
jgi:hypothetical protein